MSIWLYAVKSTLRIRHRLYFHIKVQRLKINGNDFCIIFLQLNEFSNRIQSTKKLF